MKNVTIEITVQQTNTILGALGKLPLADSLDSFMAVKSQAEAQLAAKQSGSAPGTGEG